MAANDVAEVAIKNEHGETIERLSVAEFRVLRHVFRVHVDELEIDAPYHTAIADRLDRVNAE